MEEKQYPSYIKQVNSQLWFEEGEVWYEGREIPFEEQENKKDTMRISYRLKDILSYKQSPFQEIAIVDTYAFGPSLILDGIMQTTSADGHIYNEMISHVPVITHENPQNALVIGGGDCGVVRELSKYDCLTQIDMIELDQMVTEECIKHLPEVSGGPNFDRRVQFKFEDGVEYMKNCKQNYDVVIVDSPDPIGPAKDLFGKSFYANVKKSLNEDGVVVCQSQSPMIHGYIQKNTQKMLKDYFNIVRTYIAYIPTYPGGIWSFTIASDIYDPLDADPTKLSSNTKYINQSTFSSCFQLPNFMKGLE